MFTVYTHTQQSGMFDLSNIFFITNAGLKPCKLSHLRAAARKVSNFGDTCFSGGPTKTEHTQTAAEEKSVGFFFCHIFMSHFNKQTEEACTSSDNTDTQEG